AVPLRRWRRVTLGVRIGLAPCWDHVRKRAWQRPGSSHISVRAAGGLPPSHASLPCVEYSPAFSAIDGAPREDRTMTDERIIEVKPEIAARAHVNAEQYRAMYAEAQSDPDGYWAN